MRIYIKTTNNTSIIPFDYQQKMIGVVHKWLGNNEIHDQISLYSFSWLLEGKMIRNKGYDFPNGATFFISFYEEQYLKMLIHSILSDPEMFCGLTVCDIMVAESPKVEEQTAGMLFRLASPVFIKRASMGGNDYKFYFYTDEESSALMTETLKHKMQKAGLPDDDTLRVTFDLNYSNKRVKKVTIHGIANLANMCPVIVFGKPESKLFAWTCGIGNSSGSGFGALY